MKPVQCRLWQKKNLTMEDLEFENVHTYEDDFHIWHKLKKCPECGQLYFYQFYEDDWMFGDEEITVIYIPVESREEADKLAEASPMELMVTLPHIRKDHRGEGGKQRICWFTVD